MTFETELRDQLHAGVDDSPIDLDRLLLGGVAYGNKLVRRRRMIRIFAGAATVALLGGAFAYAGSLSNTPGGNSVAPAGQATVSGQKKDITPQAALKILLETLPSTKPATNYRGGFDGMGRPLGLYALVDYTDGGSTAMIRAEILTKGYPLLCSEAEQGCRVTTLPDGSTLRLMESDANRRPNGKISNFKNLQANLARKDGLNLNLLAVNYEQDNPNTSPSRPPVSLAELKAIATSPRWQLKLDQAFLDSADDLFVPRQVTQPSVPDRIGTAVSTSPFSPTSQGAK
jgi:hypothetical protein